MKAQVRYTSASAMPFEKSGHRKDTSKIEGYLFSTLSTLRSFCFSFFGSILSSILPHRCITALMVCYAVPLIGCSDALSAELIDRVIASVDDTAITLREFNEHYDKAVKSIPDISREEVLNTLINRILLLREARKLKIEAPTDDELLNEYIELKVKTLVRIREEEIKSFYDSHISEFKDVSYESARDRIEEYLFQLELNRLLKRHIDGLRASSYIKINQATLF